MAYTESSLSKINKDDLVRIALDIQNTKVDSNSVLTDIKNELSELRKNCNKLETELAVFGFLSNKDSHLDGTVLQFFEKMDVKVDPQNVKDCHWLKSNSSSKKAIIKLFKWKDGGKRSQVKN